MVINGMPDHIHMMLGFSPDIAISKLVGEIKSNTTNFINAQRLVRGKFEWQRGFGAFTYSKSQVERVINYIMIQEEHHKKKTFREEYLELLEKFEVKYRSEYLFEWYSKG